MSTNIELFLDEENFNSAAAAQIADKKNRCESSKLINAVKGEIYTAAMDGNYYITIDAARVKSSEEKDFIEYFNGKGFKAYYETLDNNYVVSWLRESNIQ